MTKPLDLKLQRARRFWLGLDVVVFCVMAFNTVYLWGEPRASAFCLISMILIGFDFERTLERYR